jgi:hypothetical protein
MEESDSDESDNESDDVIVEEGVDGVYRES